MSYNSVGIVTMPISSSGIPPLRKLIDVLSPISDEIYLVTGEEGSRFFSSYGKVKVVNIEHDQGDGPLSRAVQYAWTQVRISTTMLSLNRKVDMWILYIGGDLLVLPMASTRIMRKPTAILYSGSSNQLLEYSSDDLHKIAAMMGQLNSSMADRLILYSPCLVEKYGLQRFSNKVMIADQHFQDFSSFKRLRNMNERENVIAYFGRFSEEKGVLDLLRAIPLVKNKEVKFQLFGQGCLKDRMLALIDELKIADRTEIRGWIKQEDLPTEMNRVKAVILPSYTEGMPNIILEAMSCGAAAIATSAGAITDVIKDDATGFLIQRNTPEAIADAIDRMISCPNLEEISTKGEEFVHQEFTFESRSLQWTGVISALSQQAGRVRKAKPRKSHFSFKVP